LAKIGHRELLFIGQRGVRVRDNILNQLCNRIED
jgi:hypothetical protein